MLYKILPSRLNISLWTSGLLHLFMTLLCHDRRIRQRQKRMGLQKISLPTGRRASAHLRSLQQVMANEQRWTIQLAWWGQPPGLRHRLWNHWSSNPNRPHEPDPRALSSIWTRLVWQSSAWWPMQLGEHAALNRMQAAYRVDTAAQGM